jgi:hypothetical protein
VLNQNNTFGGNYEFTDAGGTLVTNSVSALGTGNDADSGNLRANAGGTLETTSDLTIRDITVDPDLLPIDVTVTKTGAATASVRRVRDISTLAINAGTISVRTQGGATGTSVVKTLTIASGAALNQNNNDLIVNYTGTSPEFELRDKVLLARDGDAEGIFFTGSDDDFSDTVLAFGEAAELGFTEFNGITVDDTTILGKYTYYGDANFDGQVTTDDYVAVDLGLGTGDSWVQGDFDLNGVVTTDDYVVVDLNLGKGTDNPLAYAEERAEMIALHTEMFGQSYVEKLAYAQEHGWVAASVPEPGALGLVGMGAMGLLSRRRRRA